MESGTEKRTENTGRIIPRVIEDEMKRAYIDYSMSVIVSRALPDARDGLKPVHRRILVAMNDLGLVHNKRFRKCAKICGDVSGNYHPHGEAIVYPSLVRLAQPFSLRYPLVDGQGNFGSIDGENAAAMRYTEARMTKLTEELLKDLDKETVDYKANYDNTTTEPEVLPARAPNLLLNGASGIAVGMATNIPPHNVKEVCAAVNALIDNPDITIPELSQTLKGPDFPTGGIICGRSGIVSSHKRGKGKILVRARTHLEDHKNRTRIIVDEIPYQVNKAQLIKEIAELVNAKKLQGISDLRDESDRDGMRVVIELKNGANSDVVLNQLFSHTRMQVTFGAIMLALVDNQPKILTIKELLEQFILHRRRVIRRRTEYEKKHAEKRAHILEGLIIALDDIDNAIEMIKSAPSAAAAKEALLDNYKLSQDQAQAILDMRLQKLTGLEQDKIRKEHKGLLALIEELKAILADEKRILAIIKTDMAELIETYGDERRTTILDADISSFDEEDLIKPEEAVVTITHRGYVKRLAADTYKQQKRGGRGIVGASTKETDFIEDLFIANTRDYILFFTNKGKLHWLKVYKVPESSRQAQGTPVVNLVSLEKGEQVTAFVPVKEFKEDLYLIMATKYGVIKRVALSEFSKPRKGGIKAIGIPPEDELVSVALSDGDHDVIIGTRNGMAIRFHESKVRSMGRTAYGVIGIKLKGSDQVIGMVKAEDNRTLLTITEKGYGKRTDVSEYRTTGRGGVGVRNIKITEKNGHVVAIKSVEKRDEIILISKKGIVIRMQTGGISDIGRNTQGLRVMRLDQGDSVVSAAKIINDETEEA